MPENMASTYEESFVARSLREDSEIAPWGDLCARGFSHRPGAPERFLRKYLADPTARLEWTRVVVDSKGNLVGSVRVFEREWSVDGTAYKCAGLGEVCSDPSMRGKGIATVALTDAVKFCDQTSGASFSALHAAAAVAPLYQRFGYRACPIPYTALAVPPGVTLGMGTRCRTADLAREWKILSALHDDINVRMHVTGWTVRNEEYWKRWVKYVSGDNLLVFEDLQVAGSWQVVAYAVVASKPDGCKLVDFGARADADGPTMMRYIQHAALCVLDNSTPADCKVLMPSALARLLEGSDDAVLTHESALDDVGWMVRSLTGREVVADNILGAAQKGNFLVWQIDSF